MRGDCFFDDRILANPTFLFVHLSMPDAAKPRARLSEAQVIKIFRARAFASKATNVASVYKVSEKTVRDIWKGRTWSKETQHLDMSRPLQIKTVGRPKGCKDRQPRKKRGSRHHELSTVTRPAWHLSSAASGTFTTLGHKSVNEQLHEWDEFCCTSFCKDPFCDDWRPC